MWSRDLIELMLSLYGQHENLYNVRHHDYLDRVKRSNSLFEIYERLKEVDSKVTVEGIKAKIHGMRSQYIKEVNEVKASKRSGAGGDDVYVPKLWWFSQMEFLPHHVNTRPSSSNRCDNNKENETNDVNNATHIAPENLSEDPLPGTSQSFTSQTCTLSTNTPSPCTSRSSTSSKKRKVAVAFSQQIHDVKCLVSKRLNETNEYEWLTKLVDFEFKNIKDEGIKRESSWKIQNVLRDAAMEDRARARVTAQATQRETRHPTIISTPEITTQIVRPTPIVARSALGTPIQPTSMPDDILQQSLLAILDDGDY